MTFRSATELVASKRVLIVAADNNDFRTPWYQPLIAASSAADGFRLTMGHGFGDTQKRMEVARALGLGYIFTCTGITGRLYKDFNRLAVQIGEHAFRNNIDIIVGGALSSSVDQAAATDLVAFAAYEANRLAEKERAPDQPGQHLGTLIMHSCNSSIFSAINYNYLWLPHEELGVFD